MKKNKIYLLAGAFLVLTSANFAQTKDSETSLYNEINTAFSTGFYPGVIERSADFEKLYPESAYINDIRLQKSRALVIAGQYDSAIETLLPLINSLPAKSDSLAESYMLLGRAYYEKGKYKNAVSSLYISSKLSKGKNEAVYCKSVFFAGLSYFNDEDFARSVAELEYVVTNGNKYSFAEYCEALQKLILAYNGSNQSKKSVQLFNQLNESDFSNKTVYFTAAIYTAAAFENLGENQKAFDLYSKVIDAKIKNLSVIALKKAYLLADQKKVSVNPGEIFSRNETAFENQPELVCDFWIRLGIDEFNKKNYQVASSYFENGKKMIDEEDVNCDKALILLYEAKINLETLQKNQLKNSKQKLLSEKKVFEDSKTENILDSYYSTLILFNVVLEKWDEIPSLYDSIKNPDSKCAYYAAAFYYNKNDFASAQKKLEPFTNDSECKKLMASCYLKTGNYAKAIQLYQELELDEQTALEYSKALFYAKRYNLAFENASLVKNSEGNYISGLCLINLQKWNKAREYFNSYIKTQSSAKDFNNLALFYKGYAEYNLGEFKNSYATFVRFTTVAADSVNVTYLRKAYDFATKCALQNGDFKNASVQAEALIRISKTKEEKQEAVLLTAQIYSDSANYEKALECLASYTNEKTEFGLQALYQTALIYEKKGDYVQSEANLEKIISKSPKSQYAEDAMFHQGEMYYSAKDFVTAENRFNKYVYKYADGKYSDAALFYCADCDVRLGAYEKAIMLSEFFISKYERNTYSYGVYTNLMNAYYDEEEFESSLKIARLIIEKYPQQAADDGLGKKANELAKLVSGTNKTLTLKQNQYERLGKTTTVEGRNCGTELVQLYLTNGENQKAAFELALEVSEAQSGFAAECGNYAANLNVVSDYYRKNGNAKKAAENYLKAAMAFRSAGLDENAAQTLYSAAEAFVAAKLSGDAKETGKTLKELYPESEYAKAVDRITGN